MTEQTTPAASVPVDFVAILSAMQDQIDDLTATAEAHQRHLDELDLRTEQQSR
jgi:hypothetical protein